MRVCLAALFTLIYLSLAACSTLDTGAATSDEKAKISTAKINVRLGIAYLEMNNVQRAKQKLLLALTQAPHIPEPWYAMGYFLETTGNKEEAQEYYVKAIKIAPSRGDVQNNFGTFLCRQGRYEDSIQHFMLAVKDPDYISPADAYENAGMCALKIPNHPLADQYFALALKQDPNRPISYLNLAEMDYKKGDMTSARKNLNHFDAISPPNTRSLTLASKIAQSFLGETTTSKNTYSIEDFQLPTKPKPMTASNTIKSKTVVLEAHPPKTKNIAALFHAPVVKKTKTVAIKSIHQHKPVALTTPSKRKNVIHYHVYNKKKTAVVRTLYL